MKDLYANVQARLSTVAGDSSAYYIALRQIREEYLKETDQSGADEFQAWVVKNYGFEIQFEFGGISEYYKIIDQDKFLLAVIKFGLDPAYVDPEWAEQWNSGQK